MAGTEKEEKVVVSGYVRESTQDALREEATRREALLKEAIGSDSAPKVSVSGIVGEILENWRAARETTTSARKD